MFEPRCDSSIRKDGKQKEAIDRTISAMTGISVVVEIVLQKVFREIKNDENRLN
jgi:hypothetical protein